MSLKAASLVGLLALALAAPATAQINLSWDDCGVAGKELKTWACNANPNVAATFYGSFVVTPQMHLGALTGAEGILTLYSAGSTLPAWWEFGKTSSCRQTGYFADFILPCESAVDYWGSIPGGPLGGRAYWYGSDVPKYGGPIPVGGARLYTVNAIDGSMAYAPGLGETYAFDVRLKGIKTTGTGACGGCLEPMGIVFDQIKLTQLVAFGDVILTQPADRNWIDWQCPGSPLVSREPGFGFYCATPVRSKTWGQVKALYR